MTRLSSATVSGTISSPNARTRPSQITSGTNYEYDPNTLRLTQTTGAEYSTNTYDDNGNLTADSQGSYFYRPDNMTRASIVNGAWSLDTYDGDNQRIARWDANGTYITIQAGGRPLTSFNPVPGPLNWQRDSIYLGSQLIATLQPWGEGDFDVQFFHQDAVGSVRAVTDYAGATRDRYDYGAFGEGPGVTFSGEKQRFAGTERDWETLLDYMGARYSRSVTGRFNSVDPGHANGSVTRPQSWNAYAYASNNPLRFVDPTGLSDSPIGGDKDLGLNLLISDSAPGMFDLDEFNAWASDYVWNNEYITTSLNQGKLGGPGPNVGIGPQPEVVEKPTPPEVTALKVFSDFWAGAGDCLSGGCIGLPSFSEWARIKFGSNEVVSKSSGAFAAGDAFGFMVGSAAVELKAAGMGFGLRTRVAYHAKPHPFPSLGGARVPHFQVNFWLDGVKGSGGTPLRIPVRWW